MGDSYPNNLFEKYVEHSYRYYQCDDPIISDSEFDSLCYALLKNWNDVTHPDKDLTDESALTAGTGYQMMFKWPKWVKERVNG